MHVYISTSAIDTLVYISTTDIRECTSSFHNQTNRVHTLVPLANQIILPLLIKLHILKIKLVLICTKMFVVVFLNGIKKYIPIVEEWIFDIDEQSLKNNGVNSNRNVLIFYSINGINDDGIPNS